MQMRGAFAGFEFVKFHLRLPLPSNGVIDRCGAYFGNVSGWRRYICAIMGGGLATLALPPIDFLPALFLSISAFVLQLDRPQRTWRTAFALGWSFGFGYFAFGLYWIGNAMLVFGDQHAWMLPFAALGLPAFLAIFTGVAACVASLARGRIGTALAVAVAFASVDWLRGHVLTGLPWNLFGHAWSGLDPLLQSASLYGIYGMGLLALVAAALPAAAIGGGRPRHRLLILVAAGAVVVVHWGGGVLRLAVEPPLETPGVGIRLVQANIPQREKWARRFQARNIGAHYRLSLQDRPDWITHVIWPEMAATIYLAQDAAARKVLAKVVPENGLLITGAPRREAGAAGSFNSVLAMNATGEIVDYYDKAHLVPFGEYVPLASVLPIKKITQGALGYRPGKGVRTMRLPGLPPVSLLVCYEIIFPGEVINPLDRPSAIVNLTNDAWYGVSAGPHQHFAYARVRAVEEGMPVLRAAYTGMSGAFGPYGRVLGVIPLNERGFLDIKLPKPLSEQTVYGEWRELLFFCLLIGFGGISVFLSRRRI
jgi:apolipoprotein N-acyltransferase